MSETKTENRIPRPPLEEALDVRSYERIVVITDRDNQYEYPEAWLRATSLAEVDMDQEYVFVIDRIDISKRMLASIGARRPRLIAFCPGSDQERAKKIRKALRSLYPFSEVWETSTTFGRTLITPASGPIYDHDQVLDMRTEVSA